VKVYTHAGRALELTAQIGRGGEGAIYAIAHAQLECAKVYGKSLSPVDRRKLSLMVQQPPNDPMYAIRKHRSIAWPTELLFDDLRQSQCIGFVMPKVDVQVFRKALCYCDPGDRTRAFGGGFNWRHLFTTAYNLTTAVAAIHQKGFCIGDLNESNILIAPNALITLIDCDSFQATDPDSGEVYRCPVGKDEYTAPELHGKNYREVDRTSESDCFALAVMLFQLLMEGTHPYQAKGRLVDDAPSTPAKILKGHYPYARLGGVSPPDHAPPIEILHPDIRGLFERCFVDGHRHPDRRPTAMQWLAELQKCGTKLRRCSSNENHWFLDHLNSCPWCDIGKTKKRDPFPSPIGQQIELEEPDANLDSVDKRLAYLRSYAAMALVDGVLTTEEDDYLKELGARLQIPRKQIERAVEEQAQKAKARLTSSGGATPQLSVSKSQFEFPNLRATETREGRFTLSNTGGGILRGSIKSNERWLHVRQTAIDTARHNQEIEFIVDPAGLPLGFREKGAIEIQSNGGTALISIELSVEIPDVALSRFRKSITLAGLLAGGTLGYLLHGVLPAGTGRESSALAGLVALGAVIVVGAKSGGVFGGGFSLVTGSIVLAILNLLPTADAVLSWGCAYGTLLNLAARRLFVLRQKGVEPVVQVTATSGVALAAGIVAVGALASASSPSITSSPVQTSQTSGPSSAGLPGQFPLSGTRWVGTVDRNAAELEVTSPTVAVITYGGIRESLSVETSADGQIVFRGTAYQRVGAGGFGSFSLDTFHGRLSPDRQSISGTWTDAGRRSGRWVVSRVDGGAVQTNGPKTGAGTETESPPASGVASSDGLPKVDVAPAGAPFLALYEAEGGTRSGSAKINTEHSGYSGNGYVDGYGFGGLGSTTTFRVSVPSADDYVVALRYANAMGRPGTLTVYVNSAKATQTVLPPLSSWATWSEKPEVLHLTAGENTIAYRYGSEDSGNVNLDSIRVSTVRSISTWSCDSEATTAIPRVRSTAANSPTNYTITNETQDPLVMHWLDYEGQRRKWFDVPPGQTRRQDTFVTHPWLVADSSGKCILIFNAPLTVVVGRSVAQVGQPTRFETTREAAPNRPPSVSLRISGIFGNTSDVRQGQRVRLYAQASDPDGDPLRYEWRSTIGQLQAIGQQATLNTTSVAGPVVVSVVVEDTSGNRVQAEEEIVVRIRDERGSATIFGRPNAEVPRIAERRSIFQVRHRHVLLGGQWQLVESYCVGTFELLEDAVSFTTRTSTDNRRDDIQLLFKEIKKVELRTDSLHIATNGRGDWDFNANRGDLDRIHSVLVSHASEFAAK
jgi:serine/threonine protein kinase